MRSKLLPYIDIMKPRILTMVLVVTAIGFFLGAPGAISWSLLAITLVGTGFCCAGASVLNNYLEREVDGLMKRTQHRALPTGIIQPGEALSLGIVLVLIGTTILVSRVNLLTGFLALLTAFLYVLVYTPLKRITWLNTFIGAIPGAIPPMGGWAAATGELGLGAWVLFAILFLWQHPHFYSIAWMYREDYRRGGFKMLPVVDPGGDRTFRQIVFYSVILIPVSLLPTLIGMSGKIYFYGTLLAGLWMLARGIFLFVSRSSVDAKKLLRASIVYLPVLFGLILLDVGF